MKRVFAHIYSDGGHCEDRRRDMVVLLVLTSPDALSEPLGAGARPVTRHFAAIQ